MARSRRIGRSRFTLALAILLSLTIITIDKKDTGPVRSLRNGVSSVLSPIQSAGSAITSPFRDWWHGATSYDKVKKENERLKRQLDQANGDRLRVQSLQRQNDALKKAANIKGDGNVPMVGGRVVSGPLSNFDQTIQINVGTGDGVKVGMAVITDAGLVGKVVRVYGGTSVVQLVTDPDFKMGVKLVDANAVAVAHGQGERQPMAIDGGVDAHTDVRAGQIVTTSGIDRSAFPPDVAVGTVKSVKQSEDATEKSVQITPSANLNDLSYVEVLLYDAPR